MDEKNEEKPVEREEIIFTITFTPKTGNISITGPILNEMLSLWLLEKAKDMVKTMNIPRPTIIPAKGNLPPFRKTEN